jgi:hypothetical protein
MENANLDDVVAELGRRWEILDVKFKIYPTPGFNQPVVWLASEMTAQHKLRADEIERITLEMNYLETLYPTPRFPRPPAPDGSGFGRTAYMVAATVVVGDYPCWKGTSRTRVTPARRRTRRWPRAWPRSIGASRSSASPAANASRHA